MALRLHPSVFLILCLSSCSGGTGNSPPVDGAVIEDASLVCRGETEMLCNGRCDIIGDDQCGDCNWSCSDLVEGLPEGLPGGGDRWSECMMVPGGFACLVEVPSDSRQSCNSVCAAVTLQCDVWAEQEGGAPGLVIYQNNRREYTTTCDEVPVPNVGDDVFAEMLCFCREAATHVPSQM